MKLMLTEGTALNIIFNRQAKNYFLVVIVVLVLRYTAALLLFGGYNINNTCFDTVTLTHPSLNSMKQQRYSVDVSKQTPLKTPSFS